MRRVSKLTRVCIGAVVLLAAMWIRSHWLSDNLFYARAGSPLWCVCSEGGRVQLAAVSPWPSDERAAATFDVGQDAGPNFVQAGTPRGWGWGGVQYESTRVGLLFRRDGAWCTLRDYWDDRPDDYYDFSRPFAQFHDFRVHYGVMIAIVVIVPLVRAARRLLAARHRRSRLERMPYPACGYDVRATPERCPECGQSTSISSVARSGS